eukprot:12446938-Heterocapsa_arctica.AAC.1
MGHEVQTSGNYAYCLGCGRETKAKHSTSATLFFGEDSTVNRWSELRDTGIEIITLFLMDGGHVTDVLLEDQD